MACRACGKPRVIPTKADMNVIKKAGFTLYELLMVITILAILSTLAFSKYGLVQRAAAQKLSLSNQLLVSKAVDTYLGLNNEEGLDKLDALIDTGTASGSEGTYDYTLNGTGATGGIYRGPKPYDSANITLNNGIDSGLADVLCVYYLTSADTAALKKLGLNFVMRSVTAAPTSSGYGTGDDGSLILIDKATDPETAACFATTVTNGLACAAIDPRYQAGALIYQACGQDLKITKTSSEQNVADADVETALQSVGGRLLAFGLGNSATLIGKSNGGLETVPYSDVLRKTYYRQYVLLLRLVTSGSSVKAEFAGVLDPQGNTVHAAREALK